MNPQTHYDEAEPDEGYTDEELNEIERQASISEERGNEDMRFLPSDW